MKTIAYLRVSTDSQEEDSQRQQCEAWQRDTGQPIDGWILDKASGAKPWQERALAGVLGTVSPNGRIIVSEISRIARSTIGVLTFLQEAARLEVTVVAVRNKLALDDSLHSKITVTVLALAAEIERDLLRERTKAALAARRARGLPLGRPVGSKSISVLESRAEEIETMLAARISKLAIARVLGCAPSTLYAHINARKSKEE